jgi:hypothetical protein
VLRDGAEIDSKIAAAARAFEQGGDVVSTLLTVGLRALLDRDLIDLKGRIPCLGLLRAEVDKEGARIGRRPS